MGCGDGPVLHRGVHTGTAASGRKVSAPPTSAIQSSRTSGISRYLHADVQTAVGLTLNAAPPWMMDLIKIPKSVPVSRDLLPFKLTPRPAEPESFRGISKVSGSLASGERAQQSGSPFCREVQTQRAEGRKRVSIYTLGGQTHAHVARCDDWASESWAPGPGGQGLASSLWKGANATCLQRQKSFWELIAGDGQQRGPFGKAERPFETLCKY